MNKSFLIACAIAFCCPVRGQLTDSFSDGDHSSNPPWHGETDRFIVEAGELRLSDPTPGSSNISYLYLFAPVSTAEETVWEWYVRMDFAPSASNYARIYLQAALPELPATGQTGYFLRVGGVSGSSDALELYRQDGDSETLLLSGAPGALGSQPALARIRVVRDEGGFWELWADYSGSSDLQLEGTALDVTYPQGNYAGVVCHYTATRNDDFYFDDVVVDPLFVDQQPPVLLAAEPIDAFHVKVLFDEPLDEASAVDPANFSLSGGIGPPNEVAWDVDQPDEVALTLGQPMVSGLGYVLETTGLQDQYGNSGGIQTATFTFLESFPGKEYEVLITEVMADPSPGVALPEVEFVELYNRSGFLIQLGGWTLSDGGAGDVFRPFLLAPGDFILACDPADTMLLSPYGATIGLPGFPALNNGGDHLVLRNSAGRFIHQVAYSVDWYGESDKDDGGWSLELINPQAPCAGRTNWHASESWLGGTPGQENSVWELAADEDGPLPDRIFPEDPNGGTLFFGEAMDSLSASNPLNFQIEPGIEVLQSYWNGQDPSMVDLTWAPKLEAGVKYSISFRSELEDCLGNHITEDHFLEFGLPEVPESGDVVVNEVLFQPFVGGAEFVELHNRSGKVFNLGDLIMANIEGASDSIAPIATNRLLLPGEYVVITERPSDLLARYPTAQENRMVTNELPALPDQGGNVTIYVENPFGNAVVIDKTDYSPDWHHPLLRETRGVSLERIDPFGESGASANWHSASREVGYASPTVQNSQYLPLPGINSAFNLVNPVFSPDGDGEADFLVLQYELDKSGYTATVRIYDAFGRLVQSLAQNELLGTSGHFRWDGVDQNEQKARLGIYIVWIRWVHPEGASGVEKQSCVLAGRL